MHLIPELWLDLAVQVAGRCFCLFCQRAVFFFLRSSLILLWRWTQPSQPRAGSRLLWLFWWRDGTVLGQDIHSDLLADPRHELQPVRWLHKPAARTTFPILLVGALKRKSIGKLGFLYRTLCGSGKNFHDGSVKATLILNICFGKRHLSTCFLYS